MEVSTELAMYIRQRVTAKDHRSAYLDTGEEEERRQLEFQIFQTGLGKSQGSR